MILVTGAAGLSGSIVIQEFARQKTPVRALVRDRAKAQRLEVLPGVEIVEGDMSRPETLGAALNGVKRVLVISTSAQEMVETQCTFIDACKQAGVPHVVKFSGAESGVGFDPNSFRFMQMHEAIERYLEGSGLAWTHLRPSQFMQIYFRELPTIKAADAIFLPMGSSKLSPVDLEDVAKVAFAVLQGEGHEGKSYEMTGPEALTMAEVAERISQASGKTVRYVDVTPEEKRKALLAAGIPPVFADALDELFAERRRRVESRVYLGTHEAFGIRPTPFAEFAHRNAAVFRGGSATPAKSSFSQRTIGGNTMKSIRIDYTIRPEVDLDELKHAIGEFVAGIGAQHPENLYTSFQYVKDPRRFTHVAELVEESVPAIQEAPFFHRFTTYLRERCAAGPEVAWIDPVASTRVSK